MLVVKMIKIDQRPTQLGKNNIFLFRLTNTNGSYIECSNYGASLVSIVVPDKKNIYRNIILNYSNFSDYLSDEFYVGSTVGRVANRIAKAEFSMDNKKFYLDKNDGNNCNHGGFLGFNKKIFDAKQSKNKIIFSSLSTNGEGGFPGNINIKVAYSFNNKNEIIIDYEFSSDEKTPVNLTNHSYFNLSDDPTIFNHELKIYSSKFLEMNNSFLPTGKILNVFDHPAYNFQKFMKIGEAVKFKNNEMVGYNTYFIVANNSKLKKCAILKNINTGLCMTLYTTMPGFMLYTGDFLDLPFAPFQGICMEAQHYPDAMNHPEFPSIILSPHKTKKERIKYKVSLLSD